MRPHATYAGWAPFFFSVCTAAVCNDQKRRGDHVAHGVSPGSENSRAINFGYEHCKWHLHNAFALALHQQQRSNVLVQFNSVASVEAAICIVAWLYSRNPETKSRKPKPVTQRNHCHAARRGQLLLAAKYATVMSVSSLASSSLGNSPLSAALCINGDSGSVALGKRVANTGL